MGDMIRMLRSKRYKHVGAEKVIGMSIKCSAPGCMNVVSVKGFGGEEVRTTCLNCGKGIRVDLPRFWR